MGIRIPMSVMKKVVLLIFFACVAMPTSSEAQILVENFRNFDCANCKIPDEDFEHFLESNPNLGAILIFYHNRDPFPFDPFFLAAKDDVLARNSLYGVAGNPTVHVSGFFAGSGASSLNNWKTYTTAAAQQPKPATTEISQVYNGDSTFTITLNITGNSQGAVVRPYVLVAESGITEPNTKGYGLPSSGVWNNIFRDSLTATGDASPFVLSGEKTLTFTLDARGRNWRLENIKVVAFLQSIATAPGEPKSYPIIGVKATPDEAFKLGVKRADLIEDRNAFPNPFSESIAIPIALRKPAHVTVRIADLLGREVAMLIDENVAELESSVTFAPKSQVAATYVASIYIDGVLAGTQKLVYNP